MTTIEKTMIQHGVAWFGFDEISNNTLDLLGIGNLGIITNATRVEGWNGKGYAIKSSAINQRVLFNGAIIPTSDFSIRFKIKCLPNTLDSYFLSTAGSFGSSDKGVSLYIDTAGYLFVTFFNGSSHENVIKSTINIAQNIWTDILVSKSELETIIYINGELNVRLQNSVSTYIHTKPLSLLNCDAFLATAGRWLNGQIDDLQIYNKALSPFDFTQKRLAFKTAANKNLVFLDDRIKEIPNLNENTLLNHGGILKEIDFATDKLPLDLTRTYVNYETISASGTSIVNTIPPTIAKDLLGVTSQVVYYTGSDASQIVVETEVEPFSVYDYLSEKPEILVYTESTDDIIVSTTTEPFDIYDEFGDSVEVLYYTDDTEVTNADLILEANWSPLDELEGDFEVVTWTDEAPETAQRVLEMQAIPKPQFIKLVNPKRIYGALDNVLVNDISQSYRDEARYFVSGTDTTKWYVWDSILKKFIIADASSEEAIIANGMKHTDLNNITDTEWRTWNEQHLNIGIFLKDNPRNTIVSVVENVSYEDYLPRHTAAIQDTSLYILNTTAKIDIAFNGNVLKGVLSDDDLTRVQYRVLLNNRNFYPSDGSFTKLGESPQNIELVIRSKDIKIDDWNTLKVEFKDYFGTTDYWSTNFMGTYSGLMFKDVYGEYFSNEIGDVLKYLDFGVIIAGQTTIEHEVILKNQYGYDVKNVHLYANTANFPTEMTVEFSQSQSPFIPHSDLKLSGVLANNAEMPFFIRLKTKLGSTPDANGSFDIIVRADKA